MLAVMACCKGHDLQGQDHLQDDMAVGHVVYRIHLDCRTAIGFSQRLGSLLPNCCAAGSTMLGTAEYMPWKTINRQLSTSDLLLAQGVHLFQAVLQIPD